MITPIVLSSKPSSAEIPRRLPRTMPMMAIVRVSFLRVRFRLRAVLSPMVPAIAPPRARLLRAVCPAIGSLGVKATMRTIVVAAMRLRSPRAKPKPFLIVMRVKAMRAIVVVVAM